MASPPLHTTFINLSASVVMCHFLAYFLTHKTHLSEKSFQTSRHVGLILWWHSITIEAKNSRDGKKKNMPYKLCVLT